jgi:hypothetical protein
MTSESEQAGWRAGWQVVLAAFLLLCSHAIIPFAAFRTVVLRGLHGMIAFEWLAITVLFAAVAVAAAPRFRAPFRRAMRYRLAVGS